MNKKIDFMETRSPVAVNNIRVPSSTDRLLPFHPLRRLRHCDKKSMSEREGMYRYTRNNTRVPCEDGVVAS